MKNFDETNAAAPTLGDAGTLGGVIDPSNDLAAADVRREPDFTVGDVVRHRLFAFRGVVFDVDPVFANSDEWWESIPENVRPSKEQPYYHLLAENDESSYVAYVSQQNLERDDSDLPVNHPAVRELFGTFQPGHYILQPRHRH